VIYRFVPFDLDTDHFVVNLFPSWEDDTFEVFDQVKDEEAIAIDLGAWIGTTSIWLSKHFYHVVAVDADQVSLKCLRQNLAVSECSNVSICERPISDSSEIVFFGPIGSKLNESISCLKKEQDKSLDYKIQSITFTQLIQDFVLTNESLKSHKVSFIKCDIEGGEENILEDVFRFAYYNKAKIYMSFHLDWWKTRKITQFKSLFALFRTNCPEPDVCEYIRKNPFASVLFGP
jgi:FkbM family methyltransferase